MEFPVFKSQAQTYQNPNPLADNIRYVLAKKRIDELFLKWIALPQTQGTIQKIFEEVRKNPESLINGGLTPFLTSQKVVGANISTLNLNNSLNPTPHTPPRSPNDFVGRWGKGPIGPNDGGESSIDGSPRPFDAYGHSIVTTQEKNEKKSFKSLEEPLLLKNETETEKEKAKEKIKGSNDKVFNEETKLSKFESLGEKERENKELLISRKTNEFIPRFYFPAISIHETNVSENAIKIINEAFSESQTDEINIVQFEFVTTQLFELPKILNTMVFAKVDREKRGKISKSDFIKLWKAEYASVTPEIRCFNVLKRSNVDYLDIDNLKPLLKIIMEIHPGLEFLKATPEFQERYSDTVIQRILYDVDKNDDGKIHKREFKQSNLFRALRHLDTEEDINKIREYFSYEHFYVLYCKFWELDSDHDFFINKEEFSRYSGHALSKKVIDRIFEEVPRSFKNKVSDKMSYDDFIWFALSEEDKTTERSIEYWFQVLDLDQNDMITGYEMEYFYEEQKQRLEYLNHEPVYFEDIVCQLVDMFHPEKDIIFRLEHFKQHREIAGVFFNAMTNLNKFVAYEQRDPFSMRNELAENPDFSEWDRFAQHEYIRLALEEENAENSGMLDSADLWDADDPESNKGGRS